MDKLEGEIKVAYVLWTLLGMGGSERVVYDSVRKLDKKRYSIVVISFEDGPIREIYEKLGVKIYVISKNKGFDLKFIYGLRKILTDEAIDIVNAHHFGPLLYSFLATRWSKIKLVYTEHSRWQLEKLNSMERALNRFMLWRANAVVAISKQIQDYYLGVLLLRRKKVHLITNGIDLALFREIGNRDLRQRLGIGEDEKVIGTVANLRPEKNHKLLISAFCSVCRVLKDVRLLLVGLDCMEGEVQEFAAQSSASDRILFLGWRNDIPEVLRILDIFCLPSEYEGLPLTILEAMASGVPVIGSDVLGINEVIIDNANGLLFPKNDQKRLGELIVMLLRDEELRGRLSRAGRVFIEKNHCLNDKVIKYDKLFGALCGV